jgi:hypothetical protein
MNFLHEQGEFLRPNLSWKPLIQVPTLVAQTKGHFQKLRNLFIQPSKIGH